MSIKDYIKRNIESRAVGDLISILQDIQEKYGYLPQESISILAEEFNCSEHEIYGVATFYTQFKFTKPAEHQIKVCLGTACHVKGGEPLLNIIEANLGIKPGETTKNKKFSLERVACMGCCALAPVVVIDGKVHGRMAPSKLTGMIKGNKE
jgi:NADH-quinone oxidoreductase subunit E